MENKVIFDKDRKLVMPQYHSILPQSNTHLRSLNCKQNKFKCFSITIPYSFLFAGKFREYLFPKGVLFCQEKWTPRSHYILGNYDWRVNISL